MTPLSATPPLGATRPDLDQLLIALRAFLKMPRAMRATALALLPVKGLPPSAKKAILAPGRLEALGEALEEMTPCERGEGRIPVGRLPEILSAAGVEVLDLGGILEIVTEREGGDSA